MSQMEFLELFLRATAAQRTPRRLHRERRAGCKENATPAGKASEIFSAFDFAANRDVTQPPLNSLSSPKVGGGAFLAHGELTEKILHECRNYRGGVCTDQCILAEAGNGHHLCRDQPLPYGAVTCGFVANWHRLAAYVASSLLLAC